VAACLHPRCRVRRSGVYAARIVATARRGARTHHRPVGHAVASLRRFRAARNRPFGLRPGSDECVLWAETEPTRATREGPLTCLHATFARRAPQLPQYVAPCRLLCANSGHWPTAWRTGQAIPAGHPIQSRRCCRRRIGVKPWASGLAPAGPCQRRRPMADVRRRRNRQPTQGKARERSYASASLR